MKRVRLTPEIFPQSFISNTYDRSIDSIFKEIDKMLKSEFGELINDAGFKNKLLNNGYPKANIDAYPDKIIMELGIPGITKDDIKIKIDDINGTISISGKKITRGKSDDEKYCLLKELKYSSFERVFPFDPNKVKLNDSSAEFKNGILKIVIPRVEEIKKEDVIKELKIK